MVHSVMPRRYGRAVELRHLRYALAVGEALSFTRAALRLRVAQPALSRQIRQLEEELGVRLFDRNRRAVSPTAAGTKFLAEARAILERSDAAVRAMRETDPGGPRPLDVGYVWGLYHSTLPAAVARYLAARGLGASVALQPTASLANLDWSGVGLKLDSAIDDGVVVGLALWGIAETGSLVFHSAADMPILYNFLAATHIVALHASCVLPHLEHYAAAALKLGTPTPRNACFITGPSGTTDIEGSLVRGAHGPRDLHVVMVDDLICSTV